MVGAQLGFVAQMLMMPTCPLVFLHTEQKVTTIYSSACWSTKKNFLLFAEEGIKVWDDVFEVMVIQCITLQFLNVVFF